MADTHSCEVVDGLGFSLVARSHGTTVFAFSFLPLRLWPLPFRMLFILHHGEHLCFSQMGQRNTEFDHKQVFFCEKNGSLLDVRHVSLPKPAVLCPAFLTSYVLARFSCFFGQSLLLPQPIGKAPGTVQPSLLPSMASPIFRWDS